MKKYIVLLLVLVLLFCAGCADQPELVEVPASDAAQTVPPAETQEQATTPVTEPPVPVPELITGYARVNETPAILDTLMRDDIVDVVGEYDKNHVVIKTQMGYGLVEMRFLLPEGAASYEVWTGYAYSGTQLYDNFYLTGEPLQKLKKNTKVEVLADLGDCYVVRLDERTGFVAHSALSRKTISSGGSSTGADGGDISLQSQGGIVFLSAITQTGEVSGQATVLADGTEVVLGYFNRGEEIPVVTEEGFAESKEGFVTVYMNGIYAYIPQMLVQLADEEAYEEWDGYSRRNGVVYDNFHLLGDPVDKLRTNTRVRVMAELENCYLVEVNEIQGYMSKELVSQKKVSTGSGNSDNAEWSPPAL